MKIIMLILLALSLIACGSSEEEDLDKYIYRIESRPPKPIEPIPSIIAMNKFIFPENDARRSPFRPKVQVQPDRYAPNTNRPKQPLEAFALDSLKFVGTFKDGGTLWALISQPSHLVTRVKVGDYLGKDYGQIMSINEKSLDVEETVQSEGKWIKRKIKLDLRVPH